MAAGGEKPGQGAGADLPPAEHEHGGALASHQEGGARVVEVHGALGAEGHQGPRGLEGNLAGCNFLPQTIKWELSHYNINIRQLEEQQDGGFFTIFFP